MGINMTSKNTKVKVSPKKTIEAEVEVKKTKTNKKTEPKKNVKEAEGVKEAKAVKETKPVKKAKEVKTKVVKKAKEVKTKVVKNKAKQIVVDEQMEDGVSDAKTNKQRYFKLIYNNEIQGRYCGKKPKQAANKAFSSIIKDLKKNGNESGGVNVDINFSIRECTRNSKHKEYKYVGKRESLENPVKVEINNSDGTIKEIEYKFFNKLQKAPKE